MYQEPPQTPSVGSSEVDYQSVLDVRVIDEKVVIRQQIDRFEVRWAVLNRANRGKVP